MIWTKDSMSPCDLERFIKESNEIENIYRDNTNEEYIGLKNFIDLESITINDLENFLRNYQPDAKLRQNQGMNVMVGRYFPPSGGQQILIRLQQLLMNDLNAYELHVNYELLHPFTDGNGRSGRALWLWKMLQDEQPIINGFLETFYRQSFKYHDYQRRMNG